MNALVPLSQMRPGDARVAWTEETIAEMTRLCAEGKSASQIATELFRDNPGITRNAVIGKIVRLGLILTAKRNQPPTRWTEDKIERLRELAASGMSQQQIADQFQVSGPTIATACSRNGIKLGMCKSALRPTEPKSRIGQGVRIRSERRASMFRREPPPAPDSKWIPLWELREFICRFPKGEPTDIEDSFRYCGAAVGVGERYCPHHEGVMYTRPPKARELA